MTELKGLLNGMQIDFRLNCALKTLLDAVHVEGKKEMIL